MEEKRNNMAKKAAIVLAAIFLLCSAGLSIALGITETKRKKAVSKLNGIYEKSYYETSDSLTDIEARLCKASVIEGSGLKQKLLNDVRRECDIVTTNLSQLGTQTEEMTKTVKFFNQLGDYSYFLSMRLKTSPLSADENNKIKEFYDIVKTINADFAAAHDKLISGKKISGGILSDAGIVDETIKKHSTVEYPEMIYDGPFSDGLKDREVKFLKGKEEIDEGTGRRKVAEYFPSASDIKFAGEGTTDIGTYLYEFASEGLFGAAQITKVGGYLASYNAYSVSSGGAADEEECVEAANKYVEKMGYDDMKAVWVSDDEGSVYINYAFEKSGVICYPDLVKVKIDGRTGKLLGVEARNYLYNHFDRADLVPPAERTLIINKNMKVESQTPCLIPTEWNTEVVCKEVVGTAGGITYYMYFDMNTGEELKVLVETDDGGRYLI